MYKTGLATQDSGVKEQTDCMNFNLSKRQPQVFGNVICFLASFLDLSGLGLGVCSLAEGF